jgi:hypothetical protein
MAFTSSECRPGPTGERAGVEWGDLRAGRRLSRCSWGATLSVSCSPDSWTRALGRGARAGDGNGAPEHGRAEAIAAILTGPAGIGKTALWEWTLERAATLGYLVLACRTGVAEAQLPWVGLTDLLRTGAAHDRGDGQSVIARANGGPGSASPGRSG